MRALLLALLTAPAFGAHFDIVDHPQFPNGGNYATVPKVWVGAQGHWNHPHETLGEFPVHIHIEVLDAPIYAEVSEPFDLTVRVVLFRWPTGSFADKVTLQWQSGGTSKGTAGPSVNLNLNGDPAGVASETVTVTVDPSRLKQGGNPCSGKFLLKVGTSAEFTTAPQGRQSVAVKLPLEVIGNGPQCPAAINDPQVWNPQANTIFNHSEPDATGPRIQHAIEYSFMEMRSHVPILPITQPWLQDMRISRAENAFSDCGIVPFRSWVVLDPALHAGNDGVSLHGPVIVNDQHDFTGVIIDPATLTEGEHTYMARARTESIPTTCPPPPPPYTDEQNLSQEAFLLYKFNVGNVPPPPPPANDSIFVPDSEAAGASGSWDTTNDPGDIEYQRAP